MNWFDKEAMEAGLTSYRAAMEDILGIAPKLDLTSNNYNQSAMPTDFRIAWGNVLYAESSTRIYVNQSGLFEYGRPTHISDKGWLWKTNFMKLSVYREAPFSRFLWDPGTVGCEAHTDDDGHVFSATKSKPAELKERQFRVQLLLKEKEWGLRDWWAKHEGIEHFMDGATDGIVKDWREFVAKADKEVTRYEEAVSSVPLVPSKAECETQHNAPLRT